MFATPEEVRVAIRSLTDADYVRLRQHARIALAGTTFSSADELLVHVLGTAYVAAHQCGGEGRRWTTAVGFMAYLIMTMRGVASDSRRSTRRRREVRNGQGPDIEDSLQYAAPPPEQLLVEEESRRDFAHVEETVQAHFAADQQVGWVIRGIKTGTPARKIQLQAGMTKQDYDSAQRRWRRGLDFLFPGRRR
jgi:DNA-directed RNA polymerase specialized sigma24 family protein